MPLITRSPETMSVASAAVVAAWSCSALARRTSGRDASCTAPRAGGSPTITSRPRMGETLSSTTLATVTADSTPEPNATTWVMRATRPASDVAMLASSPLWRPRSASPAGSRSRVEIAMRNPCSASSVARITYRYPSRNAVDSTAKRTITSASVHNSETVSPVLTASSMTTPAATGTSASHAWWRTSSAVPAARSRRRAPMASRSREFGPRIGPTG